MRPQQRMLDEFRLRYGNRVGTYEYKERWSTWYETWTEAWMLACDASKQEIELLKIERDEARQWARRLKAKNKHLRHELTHIQSEAWCLPIIPCPSCGGDRQELHTGEWWCQVCM